MCIRDRPSTSQKHNVSVVGSSSNTNYLLSFGFLDNPGTLDNTGLKNYSGRVNEMCIRDRYNPDVPGLSMGNLSSYTGKPCGGSVRFRGHTGRSGR